MIETKIFDPYWVPMQTYTQTVCGYWNSTIFIALEIIRGCIMMLQGSVAEYLSRMQNRKLLYIYEYHVPQDDLRIYCLIDHQPKI